MFFVAYTCCEDGSKFFAEITGLCMTYDQKTIERAIRARGGHADVAKAHVAQMEEQVAKAKEQMALSPVVDAVVEFNRRVIAEQERERKRLGLAEAMINGILVREVRYYARLRDAIAYTQGGV